MHIFDLKSIATYPYEERDKNVFFKSKRFKARLIHLNKGESIPTCDMPTYVVFYVIEGSAILSVNNETQIIKEGQCMITEAATLSLKTDSGVKIVGFQISE